MKKWNPEMCAMCIYIARTDEWARQNHVDVFGRTVPYNARLDRYGREIGCSPLCPYLEISIRELG